ncbi:toll-like receptor 13 [Megalops cyprinoides]|uniref:toll-like receptor 13 n=1 Tax=Megalops cyprinoides TaxID=118141 RepID=UPI0018645048|nr:toll-like receptor 13 [Megalops cyprinoides]
MFLKFCQINIITARHFFCLPNLEYLDLSQNYIDKIDNFAFQGLQRLQVLNLKSNKISHIQSHFFSELYDLKCLMIQGNPLTHIEELSFTHQVSLQQLSLGGLQPKDYQSKVELNLTYLFNSIPSGLTNLSISSGVWPLHVIIGSDSKPQAINRQPNLHVMFHNLTKLEELHLHGCRIDSLEGGLTKDLKSLTKLFLHIENTFNMMESFTEHTMQLKYLYFYDSKLYCHCDNAWLIQWAKEQRKRELIMATSLDKLICKSDNNDLNFVTYVQHNCSTEVEFVLFVSSAFGLFFFILVVLVHRLASAYLLALFYIARGWLDEALHRGAGTQYRYDVFVSYCGKDERWVFEELLPNLEERGPPFLRLCLHNRDFQLGQDIVDNITDSLYSSRRTLCLVSRHYLHSNWCSLELRLATYRLLVERKDILILVFLEKIPPFQLSAHHRMARLVKTRTYLDWPQDPDQRVMFWDRLRAKLAPSGAA